MEDEYGDIADEDLMLAFGQVVEATPAAGTPATLSSSSFPLDQQPPAHAEHSSLARRNVSVGLPRPTPPSDARRTPQRSTMQTQALRQTTLWGRPVDEEICSRQTQAGGSRPYRPDLPPEAPTHHALNTSALEAWTYPTNLGPVRDYQFSIVKSGLFNNTLVALPTGLGKTFIAATIMLNFFRWTKSAKMVFVAPTKPLVAQQVEACLNVAGIPRSEATRLDGDVPPVLREGEWETKRLFFMTPQTLMNDLSKGYADPKSIALLVVDEAHRSTGDYAYVKVVEFIRRFSKSFRVLALTATPGSSVESVQEVINNLGISHVEIRTEESLDIRDYVHSRNIDTVILDPSDEILLVRDLLSKALKPLVDKLSSQNIYWGRDPMNLTTYGLVKARTDWMSGPGRHVNQGTKFMMFAVFSILQSLAHSIKLLNFHGIKPFYNNVADFRSSVEDKGGGGSKYKRQVINDSNFQEMMDTIEKWQRIDGFVGHPKMTYLCETLLNHFMDAGERSATRAIVFSEYRDSAEEIVRALNAHRPLIRATVFVGQADSKRTEGMKQKQQIETIEKFKTGTFNVLVATSIGEEGLDIGQVDLIICYDASASPIRMLQRMGRTGRKRAGNIVLLLMRGKEEEQFAKAKDNYEHIQRLICDGSHFELRHDISSRILPRDARPQVNRCHVDIPVENSQSMDLGPRKTRAALRKKPAKKKFNMPDGVETGFMKASCVGQAIRPKELETDSIADMPSLGDVVLTAGQAKQLNRLYRNLPFQQSNMEEVTGPSLGAFPVAQRTLRPTARLKHGEYTRRCVKLFRKLGRANDFTLPYSTENARGWEESPQLPFAESSEDESQDNRQHLHRLKDGNLGRNGSAKHGGAVIDLESSASSVQSDARRRPKAPQAPRRRQQVKTRLRRVGDHLEELGDDCERTSDIDERETDGSDSGGDLADFIVEDNEPLSSVGGSCGPSTSPTLCSSSPGLPSETKAQAEQGFGRGSEGNTSGDLVGLTPQTEDSDEDMPDLSSLVRVAKDTKPRGRKRRSTSASKQDDDDDDECEARGENAWNISTGRQVAASKRRHVVVDDSDDEG